MNPFDWSKVPCAKEDGSQKAKTRVFCDYEIVFVDGSRMVVKQVAINSTHHAARTTFFDKDLNTALVVPDSAIKYISEVGYA